MSAKVVVTHKTVGTFFRPLCDLQSLLLNFSSLFNDNKIFYGVFIHEISKEIVNLTVYWFLCLNGTFSRTLLTASIIGSAERVGAFVGPRTGAVA